MNPIDEAIKRGAGDPWETSKELEELCREYYQALHFISAYCLRDHTFKEDGSVAHCVQVVAAEALSTEKSL